MIVTSEHIFNNTKLNEIGGIMKNTQQEHDQKYGDKNCWKLWLRVVLNF